MTPKIRHLLPGRLELLTLALFSSLIILLGNSSQIINYFGLSSANDTLRQSAGSAVTTALSRLDNFAATTSIVSFGIWAFIGVISLGLVRAIGAAYKNIEYDEAVSSNRFVHPTSFKRSSFWKQVAFDSGGLLSYIGLFLVLLYCMFVFIIPVALTYTRQFSFNSPVSSVGNLLLGWFMLFCGITALYCNLKLLVYRRHLFSPDSK